MDAVNPDAFLAELPRRLAPALGTRELLAATVPPPGSSAGRTLAPGDLRLGTRVLRASVPTVRIEPAAPVDARALCEAWGISRPIAVAQDVHQARWGVYVAGATHDDPSGRHVAAEPIRSGRWELRLRLAGRPPGPLPGLAAGASPAYDLLERGGAIVGVEVVAVSVDASQRDAARPDSAKLLEAARTAWPSWRGGWAVDAGTPYVVIVEGGVPVAGAALASIGPRVSEASRIVIAGGPSGAATGSALLDVLESVALDAGSDSLRLDASAFLYGEAIPWDRHGYVVGPAYDGDLDVPTWAERLLDLVPDAT